MSVSDKLRALKDQQYKNNQIKKDENMNDIINNIDNIDGAKSLLKHLHSNVSEKWFYIGHILAKIKNKKLYQPHYRFWKDFQSEELGDYSYRQVENFISIGETFSLDTPKEIIFLGTTKLILLSRLTVEQREEYFNDQEFVSRLEEMSTREIESLVQVNQVAEIVHQSDDPIHQNDESGISFSFTIDEIQKINNLTKIFFDENLQSALKNLDDKETILCFSKDEIKEVHNKIKKLKIAFNSIEQIIKKHVE